MGLVRSTVSPSSSSMRRSTPWVLGCCGPMLMIIVWSSDGALPHEVLGLGLRQPEGRAQLAEQLLGAGRGAIGHLLRALGGLDARAAVVDVGHRASAVPLNCTGMRPMASSLRSGWPTQSSGMRIRVRSGWPSKRDAEEVEHLALHGLGAGVHVEQRRHRRRRPRAPGREAAPARAAVCDIRVTTTSKRSGSTPSGSPRSAS